MVFLNIKLKFTYYFSDLIRNVSILNFFILSSYIFTSGKHRYKLDAKKYLNRTRTELYWVECIFMKLVDTNCIWVNRRSPRKYVSYPNLILFKKNIDWFSTKYKSLIGIVRETTCHNYVTCKKNQTRTYKWSVLAVHNLQFFFLNNEVCVLVSEVLVWFFLQVT
jgi:hypothetical protein